MDASRSRVLVLDESLRGNVIAVGGYITTAYRLTPIVRAWRALKREVFGIDPRMELKYTMDDRHATRVALDAAGWNHARRVPAMLDVVAAMDIIIVVDVLVDIRTGVRPDQFYLDALGWCVRREANDVGADVDGPHWAIVDMPPQSGELDAVGVSDRLRSMHQHVGTAAFDFYQRLFLEPQRFGWGQPAGRPLRDLGFAPTLVAAHARHSDLLQVADVVVGTVRDFVSRCIAGADPLGRLPAEGWREDNVRRIGSKFRRGAGRVCGYGFDAFPPEANGVPEIRARLETLC
jgi:hypothetical protein